VKKHATLLEELYQLLYALEHGVSMLKRGKLSRCPQCDGTKEITNKKGEVIAHEILDNEPKFFCLGSEVFKLCGHPVLKFNILVAI